MAFSIRSHINVYDPTRFSYSEIAIRLMPIAIEAGETFITELRGMIDADMADKALMAAYALLQNYPDTLPVDSSDLKTVRNQAAAIVKNSGSYPEWARKLAQQVSSFH